MIDTWLISDTHFNHSAIIKYCNRPFRTVEDMNETIISNWNNIVKKNDIVYHLGDFGFGSLNDITNFVSKLNGRIYLIKGNHDTRPNQWYRDCGFKEVYDCPIIIKDFLVLSHVPQPFILNQCYCNVYGHVHSSEMFQTWGKNSACMCVERHHYSPVNLDTIINKFTEGGTE
jgi:calcineurin-like phosphoesterase family protein